MIRLGPAGTCGLGYDKAFREIKQLGLRALEVEFTYGVKMSLYEAREISKAAKENGIMLSVHAPYYINLSSSDRIKAEASVKRILDSCERAHHLGAGYVVFHAGFYQSKPSEEVYEIVKEKIAEILEVIGNNRWHVELAPETTGKAAQFGSLQELIRLSRETCCHICIDFAHLRARGQGAIDYDEVFREVRFLKHIHAHFSGIEWGPKGEKRHVITEEDVIKPFAEAIKRNNVDITIINESPQPFEDCVKMKKLYDELQS